MSKNSKNASRLAKAQAITALHLRGEKGPKATTPKHSKKWGYRTNPEVLKRIAEQLKASQPEADKKDKTSAKRILRGAGKASKPQVHVG
jgi:hypothetical protein